MFISEKIEDEDEARIWIQNSDNIKKLEKIKGIGPKTIDYLKILLGLQTNAIDRHLNNFLVLASIDVTSYDEAHEIIARSSKILGIKEAYFDHSVWTYMSSRKSSKAKKKSKQCVT